MINIVYTLLSPVNRWNFFGVILLILGFILTPVLIGIPMMMIGSVFIFIGFNIYLINIINLFPGGRKLTSTIINGFKESFGQFPKLFREILK